MEVLDLLPWCLCVVLGLMLLSARRKLRIQSDMREAWFKEAMAARAELKELSDGVGDYYAQLLANLRKLNSG